MLGMAGDPSHLAAVGSVAVLADRVRRALFEHVRRSRSGVTREEAASAVGISRKLAAFHLDKLVAHGLLDVATAGGGRVGRRPKVYAPSTRDIRVSIPPRRPDVLAELLLETVAADDQELSASESVLRAARERGRRIGANERAVRRPGRLGLERATGIVSAVLEREGYEPSSREPGDVELRNCPFHPLAGQQPELVCGISQAMVAGVLDGLETTTLQAVLTPAQGRCCVILCPSG